MKILAGIHAVRHALEAGDALQELVIEKGKRHPRINELIHLARKAGVRVSFVPRQALDRLAGGTVHQGAVAKCGRQPFPDFDAWLATLDVAASPLLLLLDRVTDAHNLGACLRTAAAAGCSAVILPRDHAADPASPVVAKAACGAVSRLNILVVTNLARAMQRLQAAGIRLCGLAGEATSSIYEAELSGPLGLVMGAEEKGLRRLVRERCDQLVSIPMSGLMESLNVSVATGIALFEARRQRGELRGED